MENENEVSGATNPDEVIDTTVDVEETEDIEALKVKLAEAEEAKRQITARAKAAEAKLKEKPAPQPITNALSKDDTELLILASQGLNDPELIGELKALAKIRGKSLIETQTDPIFIAMKAAREETAKVEKAKLGASKGSGGIRRGKDLNTPGLSDAEHRELWKAKMSE